MRTQDGVRGQQAVEEVGLRALPLLLLLALSGEELAVQDLVQQVAGLLGAVPQGTTAVATTTTTIAVLHRGGDGVR